GIAEAETARATDAEAEANRHAAQRELARKKAVEAGDEANRQRTRAEDARKEEETQRKAADAARTEAETQRGKARAELDRSEQTLYLHRIATAYREMQNGQVGAAVEMLDACPPERRAREGASVPPPG